MVRPNPTARYRGCQPDIKVFCAPDIMSCHPLFYSVVRLSLCEKNRKINNTQIFTTIN